MIFYLLFLFVFVRCFGGWYKAKTFKSCDDRGAKNSGESGNGSCLYHTDYGKKADGTNYAADNLKSENKSLESMSVNAF